MEPIPTYTHNHEHSNSRPHPIRSRYWVPSFLSALILENNSSDARDHCANERNFLSYLRLSVYLALCGTAFMVSFDLDNKPQAMKPLTSTYIGIMFWCLGILCLGSGLWNYLRSLRKYSQQIIIVQSGWVTQLILIAIAASICGVCFFLAIQPRYKPQSLLIQSLNF